MSRCPDCGMKECCGASMSEEIERLRSGYERLKNSSDIDMCNGDLAREVADEMLTPNAKVSREE